MSEDVWILGIHMTKFGKHLDKDPVDLAAEAALGALGDAGVTMKDIGVLAGGHLMGAAGGIGQQLQKQIGQTGIPVFNVANACATGATALRVASWPSRPASATWAWPSASRSSPARACSPAARARQGQPELDPVRPRRRRRRRPTGASAPRPCRASSPRSAWSTATSTAARASSSSPRSARRTTRTPR